MPARLYLHTGTLERLLPQWKSFTRAPLLTPLAQSFIRPPPLRYLDTPRNFSQTPIVSKKGGNAGKPEKTLEDVASLGDPQDFSSLEAGIQKAIAKLQDDLSKFRAGGRFNPELLENVRVHLNKDSNESYRLGDLAQVMPKGGKSIIILVGEINHVKPIISAIQGAKDLSLQPQRHPEHALELNIAVPPPTKASRELALVEMDKAGEKAGFGIRDARAAMQKRLRSMELSKVVSTDLVKKARKDMEKVVEKGNANVKKAVEEARKVMSQL